MLQGCYEEVTSKLLPWNLSFSSLIITNCRQEGRLASSYSSDAGCQLLQAKRSACHHEFDVFQLDRYISLKDAIMDGDERRGGELCESMSGLAVSELDSCRLLCDSSKLQLVSRYRPLPLVCVDCGRQEMACMLLQHGCRYDVVDNLVLTCQPPCKHWVRSTSAKSKG